MEKKTPPKWANVWGFFAATYAVSWLIWLPAILSRGDELNLLLVVLGVFVPSTVGIVFTYLTQDRSGRRGFWCRVVDVRCIGWRWWAVIVLIFPLTYGVSGVMFTLLGGALPTGYWALFAGAISLLAVAIVAAWGTKTLASKHWPATSREASAA